MHTDISVSARSLVPLLRPSFEIQKFSPSRNLNLLGHGSVVIGTNRSLEQSKAVSKNYKNQNSDEDTSIMHPVTVVELAFLPGLLHFFCPQRPTNIPMI